MRTIVTTFCCRFRHPSAGSYPEPWRQWGTPVGLALGLSLATLGLVLTMAHLGSGQADASPLAQPVELTVTRGQGDCLACMQADPEYDAEMGFFNAFVSRSFDGGYTWTRVPFPDDTHGLLAITATNFLFWIHRSKGCGDFQMWGVSGGITVTNLAPFNVPCTGGLISDTMRPAFAPGRSILAPAPFDPASSKQTFFVRDGSVFTVTAQNRTATRMQGVYTVTSEFPGFSSWVMPLSGPQAIPPGGSGDFPFFVQPIWSQVAQERGVAASSPVQITGTLVFSFGPTARISQTLVLARPEQTYIPLAAKEFAQAW